MGGAFLDDTCKCCSLKIGSIVGAFIIGICGVVISVFLLIQKPFLFFEDALYYLSLCIITLIDIVLTVLLLIGLFKDKKVFVIFWVALIYFCIGIRWIMFLAYGTKRVKDSDKLPGFLIISGSLGYLAAAIFFHHVIFSFFMNS